MNIQNYTKYRDTEIYKQIHVICANDQTLIPNEIWKKQGINLLLVSQKHVKFYLIFDQSFIWYQRIAAKSADFWVLLFPNSNLLHI